jgi:putative ABC transport system substrate-binding protein
MVKTIALLVNPTNLSASVHAKQASEAANALGVELHVIGAETLQEIDKAFAEIAKLGISVLEVPPDAFLDSHRERIVELSAKNGITGCYPWRDYAVAGGMMSYGTNLADSYRQAGIYAGRIIKGERPPDLPVMQPTKIELVLNLKTAATLGIAVPPQLLAVADEMIE